jgi:putative transposase
MNDLGLRLCPQTPLQGIHFWARGYFVSTAGYDEQVVRCYIRNQEKADKASDFADLFNRSY